MLVRDAGEAWQIVLQTEHGELAGQFARAWAPRPEPFGSLEIVARRHDDGWFVWEQGPNLDPDGRPANFLDVPVPLHLAFYRAAIVAVRDEDAYAGLILSMHGAGIYKYRYGFQSDLRMRFVDAVQEDAARFVADQEDAYPERLAALGIDQEEAWTGYKLLQVWDRLSLYSCLQDLAAPQPMRIEPTPYGGAEIPLDLVPLGPGRVGVEPYVFGDSPGRVHVRASFRPQTRVGQRGGLPPRLLRRADRIGGADHGAGVSFADDTGDGPHGPLDLLITNATAVLGGVREEQYRMEPGTALGVANRRIVWIGASAEAQPAGAARTIDAYGMLLLPGLINTHNHLFQNLVKGMGDEMYLLPWVETLILPTVDEMTPEECYLGALLGCLEAIRSGTTALMDFMFGIPNIEVHRAVMRAMRDSGIRGFFGRATRDLNPDSGWRDPWYLPLDEVFEQMRTLAREFPSGLPVPSVLPAPGTMRTMTVGGLIRVKEYALSEGCQITIHMGEHTEERETSIDRWGIGAFQKGEEIGFLGPQVVAAHCVKLDRDDLEVIARTGTQVSYNPVSNMYLGNGFAPVLDMFELGIDVSLASDGGACGNSEDMLEVLKFGVLQPKAIARIRACSTPATCSASQPRAAPGRSGSEPTSARSTSAASPTCSCSIPTGSRPCRCTTRSRRSSTRARSRTSTP